MSFPDAIPPDLPQHTPILGDRSLFPSLKPWAYLSHAALSPPSVSVQVMLQSAITDFAQQGIDAFPSWYAQRIRLKERLGRLFDAEPENVGMVLNTTAGLNVVALCTRWKAGDRIVVFKGEFPTNVTPWQQAAREFNLKIVWQSLEPFMAPGSADLGPLEVVLKQGVRMVALSSVQFQTGLAMPLPQIYALCQKYGAQLCVDGIQGCGVVPISMDHCDFLAAGGHKWLMGPEGAGLICARPEAAAGLTPRIAGWLSHEEPADFLFEGAGKLRYDKPFRTQMDFVESGVPNTMGYAMLEASVALIETLGVSAIFAHVQSYLDALEAGLLARGFQSARMPDMARRSGILAVRPPDGMTIPDLTAELGAQGIVPSTPDGWLRFAPHWPNALDEVPRVLEAIDEILSAKVKPT